MRNAEPRSIPISDRVFAAAARRDMARERPSSSPARSASNDTSAEAVQLQPELRLVAILPSGAIVPIQNRRQLSRCPAPSPRGSNREDGTPNAAARSLPRLDRSDSITVWGSGPYFAGDRPALAPLAIAREPLQ